MAGWVWACASHVGTSHERTKQRLQDAYSCFVVDADGAEVFLGIVSDGAGSAEYGGQGAALVCRCIALAARRHFSRTLDLPTQAEVESWVDEARDRIYAAAQARGKEARDFATTLVCALSVGRSSAFLHVGDGCAVVREAASGLWVAPTWPDHAEYASMTSFVTDQPVAKVRLSTHDVPIDCLAVFSDGLERLVLDMAARRPFERFFSVVTQPILSSLVSHGRDAQLSAQLEAYLGSDPINSRTDDDKTLVIAALR